MTYRISEKAVKDIEEIWLYTVQNWSIEQADRYHNLIFDEIVFISNHFEQARNFSIAKKDYRYSKVRSHLIFYRKTNKNIIEVIRVLHEKMDIMNRLGE